jgi:hypothetical protein
MIELLNKKEIGALIVISGTGDERKIDAHTTNELMEKKLIGFGVSGLFLTEKGKKALKKIQE